MKFNTKLKLLLSCITLAMLTACLNNTDEPIARIGSYTITQKDIDYRNAVARIYYPKETRSDIGRIQLVNAFTLAQILIQNNHSITNKMLLKEEARIDSATRAPEILDKVKAVFGDDHDAYLKVFILPTYANRVIYYDFFLKNAKLQEPTRQKALKFYNELKSNPKNFTEHAEKNKIAHDIVHVSKETGFNWKGEFNKQEGKHAAQSLKTEIHKEMEKNFLRHEKMAAEKWIQELFIPVKPGQLISHIIDDHERWLVLRYEGFDPKTKTYSAKAAIFPKLDYSEWLEAEKAKVKIEI